jgi:transcriptional regulator with XRE-family HTH domain
MKKYFFTNQISNKFKSTEHLPEWLSNYPNFNDQIKLIRETLGMTQEQLAIMVNRSLRSIQHIESGHAMPRITTLYEIANALNTKLKILLIPRQNIEEYLSERATKKAQELVKLSKTSSALEIQSPSEEESKEQVKKLKREILEKKRHSLWNQTQTKK